VIAVGGPAGPEGPRQVNWNVERDGARIEADANQPATVYNVEGDGVSLQVRGNGQDGPGADLKGLGRDAGGPNSQSINLGDIEGNNQAFAVGPGSVATAQAPVHAEEPVINGYREAKAEGQGPQQQMGPQRPMPDGEKASQQHLTGAGHAPAAGATGPSQAAADSRPGTPAQQHTQNMGRGAGGRTEGPGYEKG
jgi:hypothetical protein